MTFQAAARYNCTCPICIKRTVYINRRRVHTMRVLEELLVGQLLFVINRSASVLNLAVYNNVLVYA